MYQNTLEASRQVVRIVYESRLAKQEKKEKKEKTPSHLGVHKIDWNPLPYDAA
jgi:hypothetical protein